MTHLLAVSQLKWWDGTPQTAMRVLFVQHGRVHTGTYYDLDNAGGHLTGFFTESEFGGEQRQYGPIGAWAPLPDNPLSGVPPKAS